MELKLEESTAVGDENNDKSEGWQLGADTDSVW